MMTSYCDGSRLPLLFLLQQLVLLQLPDRAVALSTLLFLSPNARHTREYQREGHHHRRHRHSGGNKRTLLEEASDTTHVAHRAAPPPPSPATVVFPASGMEPTSHSMGTTSAGKNLCAEGKVLPQLYLLGAQKCATSSFAEDMMSLGVAHAGSDTKGPKEFHFFDEYRRKASPASNFSAVQRDAWLRRLPNCTADRQVIGDYTPSNLRSVPLPKGTTPTGSHWGLWFLRHTWNATGQELNVPATIRYFYGDEASKKITFVAMLRRPIERMQSAWYHARIVEYGENWRQCRDCAAETFQQALRNTLDRLEGEGTEHHVDDWLWASMYARQIEAWLKYFEPRQLFVIPMKKYVSDYVEKQRICTDIAAALDYPADCGSLARETPRNNTHEHPSVLEDASEPVVERFKVAIRDENLRLVQVLLDASMHGATLAGYDGPTPPTANAIWQWLDGGW